MIIAQPKMYIKKTSDFKEIQPIIAEDIVGFIKFSDNIKENGATKSHFQELIESKVYFPKINFFEQNGTLAQKAIEGSTEFTKYVTENVSLTKSYLEMESGKKYCIETPRGVKFVDNQNYITRILPMLQEHLQPEKLKEAINQYLASEDDDLVLIPDRFLKRGTIEKDGKEFDYYHFDNFKLQFNKSLETTWRISCFTQITKKDVENGKLSKEFISEVLNQKTKKGSIAFDDKGKFRPFIFVDIDTMKEALREGFYYGSVHYYNKKKKKYNYSFYDVIGTPHVVLLEKPIEYRNQKEFRVISGEPNVEYGQLSTPLLKLFNPQNIKYGNKKQDLYNLNIY